MVRRSMILIAAMASGLGAARADGEKVRFPDQVAPILVSRCLACHNPKKAIAGFRVDTYSRLMSESKAGRMIEPGKPDDSIFFMLIDSNEPSGRMPKNADPLPAGEVATLRRWIEQGADSGGIGPDADLAALVAKANRPGAPISYKAPVPVAALAFRPPGDELAVGGYHEVTLWEPSTGRLVRRLPGLAQRTQGLAFTADGSTLAVAGGTPGESGELSLIDPNGLTPPRVIASASDLMLGLAISPDGSMVAASGADRTIRVHEIATGRELRQIKQFADWVTGVAFDRDGSTIVGSSADKLAKAFDARTGTLRATYIGHGEPLMAVTFDPESNRAITAGADRRLHLWNPQVIAAEDGTAGQLEERFKKDLAARMIGGFPEEVLDLVVDRGSVFSASADGKVRRHDLKTLDLVRTFDGPEDSALALAVDPEGRRLAVGGFDGSVRVFDLESGRELGRFVAAPGLEGRPRRGESRALHGSSN